MPERSHEALRTGAATEWIVDLEGVGRVRCMSFRDHRGPGGVFRMMPTRAVSAEQLGLPREIQSLAIEPEGLVLIAGPRSSGKRTMMSAFVDLINRTRRDHVITIEREINIVHERGNSFISQREVRGSDDDVLAAARAALREDPDVLVIEELRTGAADERRARSRGVRPARHRRLLGAQRHRRDRSHHRSLCAGVSPAGAAGAGRQISAASSRRCCCGRTAAAGWPRARCC